MECGSRCGRPLTEQSAMKCRLCKQNYHCECLNINLQQYRGLTKECLASWECPACCNVSRRHKGSRDNTPVRNSIVPSTEDIASFTTSRSEPDWRDFTQQLQSTLNTWRQDMDNSLSKIRGDIQSVLTEIKFEITALRTEQDSIKSGMSSLKKEISDLQTSSQYQADQHDHLEKKVRELEGVKNNARETANIVTSVEHRIDSLEQQARQCNIEICNVPDKRNENLLGILECIGSTIKYHIQKSDIVSIHRVPHATQLNSKPKNIVVKFTTRILRDNILSAFRKAKGVKSDQLGISGQSHIVYMNEHLTLKNKQLFRECREEAKKYKYKYVWIKNATILARQGDTSPVVVVRSNKDFIKFKGPNKVTDMES